ncbi:sugar phosphate isomerase/epimerase family protein [Membranihabitans marinus]|uniref:sugar phosphate isomerase/epimerase family protein n=1 Tax=Membranihabitans marinus TaxID=1227546 RepID=UPI001F3AA1DB|nr:sugar phosphate isomerase/epimerase family protein [Membranihabitans marinus]
MINKLTDTSKLCVHTITTKPWEIEQSIDEFSAAGVGGITVWRNTLEGRDITATGDRIRSNGLDVVSLCRGGFFPADTAAQRQEAIDDNKRAIDEAAALGAPLIVLVCGANPNIPLAASRDQIQAGIEAVLPYAEQHNIRLAIEPLHPMYADTRSGVNTMTQANDMAEAIGHSLVGVAVDVFHLWWDPRLEQEIQRCGDNGHLFAFHICDWKFPLDDMLNDRGLMGEGCIDVPLIRSWVEKAGFNGYNEVEIFSNRHWAKDQKVFLQEIINAYKNKS